MKGCEIMIYEESESVELKQTLIEKVKHEISAFINTNGGTIYIGVQDDGTIIGMPSNEKDEVDSKLSSWIRSVYYPNPNQFIKFHFNKFICFCRRNDNIKVICYILYIFKAFMWKIFIYR